MDYMSELIQALDNYLGLTWTTELKESQDKTYWTFTVMIPLVLTGIMLTLVQSTVTASNPLPGRPNAYKSGDRMTLVLYKEPFRIQVYFCGLHLLGNLNRSLP